MGELDGKVALVTGAGQGVGLGIAQELAEAGATVAVNDLHRERAEAAAAAINAAGGKAVAAPFDVTSLEAVRAGFAAVEEQAGPLDILVNNAGIAEGAGATGPFKDSDPSQWHRHIDLNLYGSMYCIHTALPGMVGRGWGRIVQVSSGAGSRGVPGVSIYGASKAGIEGLVRTVAMENARTGVTLNSIALGLMDRESSDGPPNDMWTSVLKSIPMGRTGKPREIGACAAWLCSEKAGWVTGQTIHVNGGTIMAR